MNLNHKKSLRSWMKTNHETQKSWTTFENNFENFKWWRLCFCYVERCMRKVSAYPCQGCRQHQMGLHTQILCWEHGLYPKFLFSLLLGSAVWSHPWCAPKMQMEFVFQIHHQQQLDMLQTIQCLGLLFNSRMQCRNI